MSFSIFSINPDENWWREIWKDNPAVSHLRITALIYIEPLRQEAMEWLKAHPPTIDHDLGEAIRSVPEFRNEIWELMKSCSRHSSFQLEKAFFELDASQRQECWNMLLTLWKEGKESPGAYFLKIVSEGDFEQKEVAMKLKKIQFVTKEFLAEV